MNSMGGANGRIPRYQGIAEALRTRIREGALRPGARLDNQRRLATSFGVTLMTLRQALELLEREHLISRRHGPRGPGAHAAPSGARARARRLHRARARDGLGGAPGTARGARARVPDRGARLRVRARLLRRGRRAGRLRSRFYPRRPLPHHPRTPLRGGDLMKIIVAVKQVPDTATQVKISADPRAIDTTGITR